MMLIEELQRLRIACRDGKKIIFAVNAGLWDRPDAKRQRVNNFWFSVSTVPGITPKDPRAFKIGKTFINHRYSNKQYLTISQKMGRKNCEIGCLLFIDKVLLDRALYLTLHFGDKLRDSEYFSFKLLFKGALDQPAVGAGLGIRIYPESKYAGSLRAAGDILMSVHRPSDEVPRSFWGKSYELDDLGGGYSFYSNSLKNTCYLFTESIVVPICNIFDVMVV